MFPTMAAYNGGRSDGFFSGNSRFKENRQGSTMSWYDEDSRPQFYNIIHASLTNTNKLRIPAAFVKHISEEQSGIAVVEGPSGNKWAVKVCKTDEGTFLQDGWEKFIEDHFLGDFEFLVFRYDENMRFYVQIFDKSACEKEDAFSVENHQEPVVHKDVFLVDNQEPVGCEKDVFIVEPLQFSSVMHGPKELEGLPKPPPKRRGRPRKAGHPLDALAVEPHQEPSVLHKGKGPVKLPNPLPRKRGRPTTIKRGKIRLPPSLENQERALTAAMSFTSTRPYFIRPLSYSSACKSFVLNIPATFARAHFPRRNSEVILKVKEGKARSVNFIADQPYTFCGGWAHFVVDNQLEAADVCIFELVAALEMFVHIFRCELS